MFDLTRGSVTDHESEQASYVIFSSTQSKDAVVSHLQQHEIGYKLLYGCYKGEQENSYLVNARNWNAIACLLAGQQTVLQLGPMVPNGPRNATARISMFHYVDGSNRLPYSLGFFLNITQADAMRLDGWTLDCDTQQYWACYWPPHTG